MVEDHPGAGVAHEGEVKAMVSRKLHPGEALLKGWRKRIRTRAAIGCTEVERRAVPAGRERDDVVPLGVGRWLPHIEWRIVPELTPGDAELLVEKHYGDAFEDQTAWGGRPVRSRPRTLTSAKRPKSLYDAVALFMTGRDTTSTPILLL